MFRAAIAVVLAAAFAISARADYESAVDAYERGDYKSAVQQLKPLADAGDPKAQVRLGLMYREGCGVARDATAAFAWLLRAARSGRADAQFLVGTMYLRGEGTMRDGSAARAWLEKSARQGNRKAQAALDQMQRESPAASENAAAIHANRDALAAAGRQQAAESTRSAETEAVLAAMDPPPSQAEAAAIDKATAHGINVRYKSLSQPKRDAAAEQQVPQPFLRPRNNTPTSIQDMMHRGHDVPSGPPVALDAAASRESLEAGVPGKAEVPVEPRSNAGSGGAMETAPPLAALERLARQGHRDAQRELATLYYRGSGTPRDFTRAAQWYRKAAVQGDAESQFVLSGMYLKGEGVPRDKGVALQWLKRAAAQGHAGAQARLAQLGG